jgi:hypothetical protein
MTSKPFLGNDAETLLPAMQNFENFDEFGKALRAISSDEESIKVSEGMGVLSAAIEKVGKALSSQQSGATIGPLLIDLLTALRKHRQLVVGLGEHWRQLYEYAAYLAALNNFRVLVGQWLVERNISGDSAVVIDEFEMIGWRTLGEGLLMIDMHEQNRTKEQEDSGLVPLDDSRLVRAKQWWGLLRG